jgi:hypothetical protein
MAAAARHAPLGQRDALSLLRAEHDMLLRLFHEYELLQASQARDDGRKAALARRICRELTVHAALEEQAFYPAVAQAAGSALLDDALVEHDAQRLLIGQLRSLYPDDPCFGATIAVLAEETRHHIAHEQGALFGYARSCGLDLQLLAQQLAARRKTLERGTDAHAAAAHAAAFEWSPRLDE